MYNCIYTVSVFSNSRFSCECDTDLSPSKLLLQVNTKLQRQEGSGEPWPVGREGHAACCLDFGSKHPCLLVIGGIDKDGVTLKDACVAV